MTLPTNTESWGFFGTMQRAGADPMQGWNVAFAMIEASIDVPAVGVRDFLDSRDGRHFADYVAGRMTGGASLETAIEAAITRFESWKIDRKLSRETGIPQGLPYLTGLVNHFAIEAGAS